MRSPPGSKEGRELVVLALFPHFPRVHLSSEFLGTLGNSLGWYCIWEAMEEEAVSSRNWGQPSLGICLLFGLCF